MFGGNFPPNGWAICAGQPIPISENDTLFTLIGTTYGGDGQTTFNLPDLQGRVPVHMGKSPATGTTFTIGEQAGVESVTLTVQQLPLHTHALLGTAVLASLPDPANNLFAQTRSGNQFLEDNPGNPMANAITPAGGSQPHDNMQPFLCINFIISLFGIFPSQT
jgi:microcystin-dependent protein